VLGDQPGPACAVCRAPRPAGDLELPDRQRHRRAHPTGESLTGTRAHVPGPRRYRQVFSVRLIIKAGVRRSISLGEDGAVGVPLLDWLATATGAHAIQTDPSDRFAFVPHIARLNDDVLEPLRKPYAPI
jgi:hypothetical protein